MSRTFKKGDYVNVNCDLMIFYLTKERIWKRKPMISK